MMVSSISARSRKARVRALGSAVGAAAILLLMAPAAQAQGLFFLFEPSSHKIERQLESAGYELRGPLVRRGDVYVADVMNETGGRERVVIDARTARIVERFPVRGERWREGRFGDWRDRDDEETWDAPTRPLQGFEPRARDETWTNGNDEVAPALRPKSRDEIARDDPSGGPTIIYGNDGINGPSTSTVDVDKPKPKPHVVKKKPLTSAPIAKAAPTTEGGAPSPLNPATVAATPPNTPKGEGPKLASPPAKIQAERSNSTIDAKPAVVAKPVADTKPLADLRPVTQTKSVADSPPPTETKQIEAKPVTETKPAVVVKPATEAKAAAPAPAAATGPRVEKKSKAVNDVPVNPLD